MSGNIGREGEQRETYLGHPHIYNLPAKQEGNRLVSPADATQLGRRIICDHVTDEAVHTQDPPVRLARVGVTAANDDEVE